MTSFYLSLVFLLGLQAGQIKGQASSTTVKYCNESASMALDFNKFSGTWYESARNPAPNGNYLCAKLNITITSNSSVINVALTYSNTPNYPWVNYTMSGNITVQPNNTAGYNISLTMNGKSAITTYKVLDTNYVNYTFICGHSNAYDLSSFFAIVLTRDRYLNGSILTNYETLAQQANYSLFSNTTMTTISQPAGCSASDGVMTAQVISATVVFFSAVLLLFCCN